MARKTVNVSELIIATNATLAQSDCSADTRQGSINSLEYVLHNTGNYRGFRYLNKNEVPKGQLPGINIGANEAEFVELTYEQRFANTDKTRVMYFG